MSTTAKLALGTAVLAAAIFAAPVTALAQPHGHHGHHGHHGGHHGAAHHGGHAQPGWASIGAGIARAIAASRNRGHYVTVTERVLVEPAHYECRQQDVLVEAGHYEEVHLPETLKTIYDDDGNARQIVLPARTRRLWVAPRYETREVQVFIPARYETRTTQRWVQ